MRYVTAVEASRRIGVSERTVRKWIDDGKLQAEEVAKNRLAISEEEIERIKLERSKYQSPSQEVQIAELSAKVAALEKAMFSLQEEMDALKKEKGAEKPVSVPENTSMISAPRPVSSRQKSITGTNSGIPHYLPPGTMIARKFAEKHRLSTSSFGRWVADGINGEMIRTETQARPGRTDKFHYLTPDQQTAALALLRRHGKLKDLPTSNETEE